MSDTSQADAGQFDNCSLEELCLSYCQFMKGRCEEELAECSRAILDLCNNATTKADKSRVSLKTFATKEGSARLLELVSCFETCRDVLPLVALLRCIEVFLNIPKNLKRLRCLITANSVYSLIKCLQYFMRYGDSNEFLPGGSLDTLVLLLLTLAQKDRKSGLKLRLSGLLQQTVIEVCRTGKDAAPCLLDILIFSAKSGRNTILMGKQKDFIPWLVRSLENSSQFTLHQMRRNCQLLYLLSKTRKNRQRLLSLGCVGNLLKLFKGYLQAKDVSDSVEICIVTLGCLRQLAKTKVGKEQLISADGLSICEEAINNWAVELCDTNIPTPTSSEAAALRDLRRSLCSLCMRCLPSAAFPLAGVPFPLTFELPTEAKQVLKKASIDEESAESDGDDSEDEEVDLVESEVLLKARNPKLETKNMKTKKPAMATNLDSGSMTTVTIPSFDQESYLKQANTTRSVVPFVKVTFAEMTMSFPDLPLQPLKDFRNAVELNVLTELQKFKTGSSFTPRIVFDLDSVMKMDRIRSANANRLRNNDLDRIGRRDRECDHLKFESRFESGNLRRAVQIGPYEYELYMSPDINQLHQHYQWFYFEVNNMVSDIPYSFKIVNCLKSQSMFGNGMQPVLFSVTEASEGRAGWVRAGHGICYYRNLYTQTTPKRNTESRGYYSVVLNITFRHSGDVCYLAYHFPYTYSLLMCNIYHWSQHSVSKSVYFRVDSLCQSLAGNDVKLLTITAAQRKCSDVGRRDVIFLTGRVHPGEANASWMMHGAIRFLLSDHSKAVALRKRFVFKIVPMLNPDGVINGSHRCSLAGQDLNRQWSDPSQKLQPTIFHTKGLLSFLDSIGRLPLVYCDFHGHSRKRNVFVYGNNPEESWWVPDHAMEHNAEHMEIPEILDNVAPAFSLSECRFSIEKPKEPSARVVIWRELGVKRTYTMEATYCGFDQGPYAGFQAGTRELAEMGQRFCEALLVLPVRGSINSAKLTEIKSVSDTEG